MTLCLLSVVLLLGGGAILPASTFLMMAEARAVGVAHQFHHRSDHATSSSSAFIPNLEFLGSNGLEEEAEEADEASSNADDLWLAELLGREEEYYKRSHPKRMVRTL